MLMLQTDLPVCPIPPQLSRRTVEVGWPSYLARRVDPNRNDGTDALLYMVLCPNCFITGRRWLAGQHQKDASVARIARIARILTRFFGMSYKQLAEAMVEMYDIPEPSKRTLYEWVWVKDGTDAAVKAMHDYPADVGTEWVADEMQVKVGGENLWHWNVMDAKTRYVLASHLSPNRDTRAAVTVMRKAAMASKNPPRIVKSDKLGSYPPAVAAVFPDAKHVQSDGIRALINNNLSERLQGTYLQREKTLRGLDNIESGQRYLDGWTLTYNLFREYEGIDYQTPAGKANVNAPFQQWEDVVKQHPPSEEQPKTGERNGTAELSDARLRDEETARGNVTFLPDPTRRIRPKGETDTDDPDDEWPPSRDAVKRWRPEMPESDDPEPAERKSVTRLPLPPRQGKPKFPTARVAAVTPKPAATKRHPFLRPSEQKQEQVGKEQVGKEQVGKEQVGKEQGSGKRPHQYAKARKAHQRQGRKASKHVLLLGRK